MRGREVKQKGNYRVISRIYHALSASPLLLLLCFLSLSPADLRLSRLVFRLFLLHSSSPACLHLSWLVLCPRSLSLLPIFASLVAFSVSFSLSAASFTLFPQPTFASLVAFSVSLSLSAAYPSLFLSSLSLRSRSLVPRV